MERLLYNYLKHEEIDKFAQELVGCRGSGDPGACQSGVLSKYDAIRQSKTGAWFEGCKAGGEAACEAQLKEVENGTRALDSLALLSTLTSEEREIVETIANAHFEEERVARTPWMQTFHGESGAAGIVAGMAGRGATSGTGKNAPGTVDPGKSGGPELGPGGKPSEPSGLGGAGKSTTGGGALKPEVSPDAEAGMAYSRPVAGVSGTKATGAVDVPATSSIARDGLRNDLAVQAGIPRSLDKVWGSSIDDLAQAYKMDGAKLVPKPHKPGTSGNAQAFTVEGHPAIKEVQYHSGGGRHDAEYYKFTYKDGAEVRVIDSSAGLKPGTITKYQQYYDKQGNRLKYEAGQWKAWE